MRRLPSPRQRETGAVMTTDSSPRTRGLAVVTGASSGIGRELARQFAEHDFDLVLAAEDAAIDDAAAELRALGADVTPVQVDLASDRGVDELLERIRQTGRPVDAVALNAGVGAGGAFATDTALQDELRLIDLNVRSTVHLAKHVVRDMVARDEGRILFTSSIASTMPGAFQAVYNASKSFVQSFALALRNELKDTGVTVTSLMPGPTDTEFFERADMLDTKIGAGDKDDPADVARDGFEALMAGDERAVSASMSTKLQGRGSRMLPDAAKAELHRRMAEPGSARKS
jgi:short-subunit dehydrogenase